jgi:hypothetical protein
LKKAVKHVKKAAKAHKKVAKHHLKLKIVKKILIKAKS